MLEIYLNLPSTIIGGYLVVHGRTTINSNDVKVSCQISQEFLEDISGGRTDYFQIFKDNCFSIEILAENKLSTNRDIDRSGELIKIKILAIDKNEFDSLG